MAKETKKTALNWDEFSAGTEEKTLTVYDKIKAEKEGILKALAAGRSYKSTADYLTAGGIKITPATLKVYLSRIRQEERDAGKNPPEVEPETGEVLEGETVEELTPEPMEVEPVAVQDQEPEPAPVLTENEGGNLAGSEPENVQDQAAKPVTVVEDKPPVNSVECPGKNAECGKDLIPEKYKEFGPNYGKWYVSCECGYSDFLN